MSLNPDTICPNCNATFDSLIHTIIRDEDGSYREDQVKSLKEQMGN